MSVWIGLWSPDTAAKPCMRAGAVTRAVRTRARVADRSSTVAPPARTGSVSSPSPVRPRIANRSVSGTTCRGDDGSLRGVEAVIDKDRVASLLARDLGAARLVISTAVEKVALHYRTPGERPLDRLTVLEARQYLAEGHFPPGSMGPKPAWSAGWAVAERPP